MNFRISRGPQVRKGLLPLMLAEVLQLRAETKRLAKTSSAALVARLGGMWTIPEEVRLAPVDIVESCSSGYSGMIATFNDTFGGKLWKTGGSISLLISLLVCGGIAMNIIISNH